MLEFRILEKDMEPKSVQSLSGQQIIVNQRVIQYRQLIGFESDSPSWSEWFDFKKVKQSEL